MISLVLHIRKVILRKVKEIAQDHITSKGWGTRIEPNSPYNHAATPSLLKLL